MKFEVTHFKSMKAALQELARFIRDGQHLYTGKPFGRFGELRSRELLTNWRVAVVSHVSQGVALVIHVRLLTPEQYLTRSRKVVPLAPHPWVLPEAAQLRLLLARGTPQQSARQLLRFVRQS
jgi:hypothetical protein